ncbi:hypothetical protein BFW38_08345 [Terasakiispira papahanaumokuakeensis]|uniref:N-acetyltransferase domain-containing protein n=1 Tax=Terasakiispira papahanaumokuakeensis TaxID=197479 RepID=A0A1E2V9Q3_9GAMM|nr:GNAT family N-acetyltransferase [Terasakiispira papahanaumokuakeensis]ODC03556.1 hypothetical protein BFW38_08345 [Terasakiispira papahanaumokuakeensis]
MTPIQTRVATHDDLPQLVGLTQALNWPHRAEDWSQMLASSEAWCLQPQGSELVGSGLCFPQGDWATIGLLIVAASHQGQGWGRHLMQTIMKASGGRHLLLTATTAGAPLYRRLGFKDQAMICQHQGVLSAVLAEMPEAVESFEMGGLAETDAISVVAEAEANAVLTLLNKASGLDRSRLWPSLWAQRDAAVKVTSEGMIKGVALRRRFGRGKLIGPVVAEHPVQALQLIWTLLDGQQGVLIRIDTPEAMGLGSMLTQWGLMQVDRVAQMVNGAAPSVTGPVQQYAMVSQAQG